MLQDVAITIYYLIIEAICTQSSWVIVLKVTQSKQIPPLPTPNLVLPCTSASGGCQEPEMYSCSQEIKMRQQPSGQPLKWVGPGNNCTRPTCVAKCLEIPITIVTDCTLNENFVWEKARPGRTLALLWEESTQYFELEMACTFIYLLSMYSGLSWTMGQTSVKAGIPSYFPSFLHLPSTCTRCSWLCLK